MKHRITIDGKTYNPPAEVLQRYLYTRKKERTIAGITIPGLFSIYNFHETLIGVLLIISFEVAAIYMAIGAGLLPLVVIILMVVDFVLAFLAHLPQRSILISKNQQLITTRAFEQIKIERRIKNGEMVKLFFDFLIVISAVIKIYFILRDVYFWQIIPATVFITVAYLIAAFLHIYCTGDFIHTLFIEIQNTFAIKKFNNSSGKVNQAKERQIKLADPYINESYILGPDTTEHPKIEKRQDGFYIVSSGIPDDKDLHELILRQTNISFQGEIIRKGIILQLQEIGGEIKNPDDKGNRNV